MLCLFMVTGCGDDATTAKKPEEKKDEKKKKEEPKPDFQLLRMQTRPNSVDTIEASAKPGHWTSATQETVANNFDYRGELVIDPLPLPGLAIEQGVTRPAVLPKGQTKLLELLIYPPPDVKSSLSVRLQNEGGGTRLETMQPIPRMPRWQYHMVVLARQHDRFAFLRGLDTLKPPTGSLDDQSMVWNHYRLSTPPTDKGMPLPSSVIGWTSIAAIIWEDIDPASLSLEQQTALVDWLHWGGLLVTSGPGTLDSLRGSFLDAYLPADPDGTIDVAPATLAELNDAWTAPPGRPLQPTAAWTVQKLQKRPEAVTAVNLSEGTPLVVNRRIGRGRVASVAFSLGNRELTIWPDFDQFFNAAVLGRPGRAFGFNEDLQSLTMAWRDSSQVAQFGVKSTDPLEPCLVSNVRYFSRDTARYDRAQQTTNDEYDGMIVDVTEQQIDSSPGGWSDFSGVANHSREALIAASGLEMPSARFVLTTLVVYIILLVPVNWLVFKLLGRVEWAWIAAPIITVLFALAVVRLAQLNIGFARAESELAIVELHGDYPRAHLTRFTSLYTSLATRYSAVFDDEGAVALPFPTRVVGREALPATNTVNLHRESGTRLDGYYVASNSLGMLHSEQMFDLGGGLKAQRNGNSWTIVNGTTLNMAGAVLLKWNEDTKENDLAWIGDLAAGGTCEIADSDFQLLSEGSVTSKRNAWLHAHRPWEGDLTTVSRMADFVNNAKDGAELRLVALVADELPGMRIEPAAEQRRRMTIAVGQLFYPDWAAPQHDSPTRALALQGHEIKMDAEAQPTGDPQ